MNGCVYLWSGNADLGFEGQPINQQCSGTLPPCNQGILGAMGYVSSVLGCTPPPPPECQPHEVKDPVTGQCGGACPAGMKLNERNECVPDGGKCPAGQTKAPDGSCTDNACPAGSAKGKDGTCKPDGDGDGNPDDEGGNEDGNTFSGGESCDVPPKCSGDPIMCGQARIQWQIYCKLRSETTMTGGSCDAMPVCTRGCDALEYSSLIQQWKTACALERGTGSLAIIGDGGGTGDGNGDGTSTEWDAGAFAAGIVDATAGEGEPCDAFDTADCGGGSGGGGPGTGELDDTGLGWGRSCPALPVVNFMGTSINFNDAIGGSLCDWIALGGQILLILAALLSLRILTGGMG